MTYFPDPDRARVLVVDDDPALRDLLIRELSLLGFEARSATNQDEAVDLLQRQAFDVVISDSEGPGMTGVGLVSLLQKRDLDAAVIVGSERATVDGAMDCLRRGAFDFLVKPYDLTTLSDRLEAASRRRRQQHLDALNSAATALLQTSGLDDIVRVVVHHGAIVLGAEAVALVLGDPFAAEATFHLRDDGDHLTEDLVAQLAQQTCQSGVAERVLAGLSYGDGYSPVMAATDFRSALCLPLRAQDTYLGTLLLLRTDQRTDFTGDDVKLGTLYSAVLTLALENVRLAGKFQTQAVIDDVTGLYSRRFLFETLWQLVKRLTRSNPPVLTCLGVGIDEASALQATLDKTKLERLVKRVAFTLGRTVRASDIVARSGPLDFIILLPQTDIPGGRLVAAKLRAAIAEQLLDPVVTVGIGIAGYDFSDKAHVRSMKDASQLSSQLLQWAEGALQTALASGRNGLHVQTD